MASFVGKLKGKKGGKGKGEKGGKAESLATAGFASRNAALTSPSPSLLPKGRSRVVAAERPSSRASSLRSNGTLRPGSGRRDGQNDRDLQNTSPVDARPTRKRVEGNSKTRSEELLTESEDDDGFYDAVEAGTTASEADTSSGDESEEEDETKSEDGEESLASLAAQMRALEAHDRELEAQLSLTMPGTQDTSSEARSVTMLGSHDTVSEAHSFTMPGTIMTSSELTDDTGTDTEYETDADWQESSLDLVSDGMADNMAMKQEGGFASRLSPILRRSQSPNDSRLTGDHASDRALTPTRPPRRERLRTGRREKHDPLALDTAMRPDTPPNNQPYRFDIRPKNPFRLVSADQSSKVHNQKPTAAGPADVLFDIEAHHETPIPAEELESPANEPVEVRTPQSSESLVREESSDPAPSPSLAGIRRIAPPAITEELLLLEAEQKERSSLRNLTEPYPGLTLASKPAARTPPHSASRDSTLSKSSKNDDPNAAILGSSMLGGQGSSSPSTIKEGGGLLASLQSFGRSATQASLRPVTFRTVSKATPEDTVIPKPYIPQYPAPTSLASHSPTSIASRPVTRDLPATAPREPTRLDFGDQQLSFVGPQDEPLPPVIPKSRLPSEPPSWLAKQVKIDSEPVTGLNPSEKRKEAPLKAPPSVFSPNPIMPRLTRPRAQNSSGTGSRDGSFVSDRNDVVPRKTQQRLPTEDQSLVKPSPPPQNSSFLATIMRMTDKLSGISPDSNAYDQPIFVKHVSIDPYTATPGERRAGIQRPHEVVPKPLPFEMNSDPKKYMTAATSQVKRGVVSPPEARTFTSPRPLPPLNESV